MALSLTSFDLVAAMDFMYMDNLPFNDANFPNIE